jgi:hypothetical protein
VTEGLRGEAIPAEESHGASYTPIQQAAARVAPITHESQGMIFVRRAEIRHWAKEVLEVVKNPLEGASAWAATMAGIAWAGLFALIGLLATEDSSHKVKTGFYISLLAVTLAAAGIGAFCWWVDRKQRSMRSGRAQVLSNQIKECEERAQPVTVSKAGDSLAPGVSPHGA